MKRSVNIAGHSTSVSLEEPFWHELKRIAASRHMSLAALIAHIDQERKTENLSSALRLAVLDDLKHPHAKTTPSGS
jgi:predicted DNA-binding ribbon-helix-helix protein